MKNEKKTQKQNSFIKSIIPYLYMAGIVLSGSAGTCLNKLIQNSKAIGIQFVHIQFIVFLQFSGELLCLLIYIFKKLFSHEPKKTSTNKAPILIYSIPAFGDFFAANFETLSLAFLPSSVMQMMEGGVIIFTALASIIFLKAKYYKHHYFGILVVIIGLMIIGINSLIRDKQKLIIDNKILLGIVLVIIQQICQTITYILEETIITNYTEEPLKVSGLEGLWATMISLFMFIPFYFIRCDSWPNNFKGMCQPLDDKGKEYRFADPLLALRQIETSYVLIIYTVVFIVVNGLTYVWGLYVVKYESSTSRTVIITLRSILIWGFFLTPFVPENTKEHFSFIQLVGFVVLVVGTGIYNELIEIPFCGCNKNMKKTIELKDIEDNGEKEEELVDV